MFNDDLIQVYKNTIDREYCDYIIETFEDSTNKIQGLSGGGVNLHMKKSVDLMINDTMDDPRWGGIYNYLRENLLGNFVEYITKNPYMIKDRSDNPQPANEVCMLRTAQSSYKSSSNGNPHMQMQRYHDGEGYYQWHYENEGGNSAKRQMFFIYYLNDVNTGGETEFQFNRRKVAPTTGTLLVAPAFWTHRHKGYPPLNGEQKYIITGWFEMADSFISDEFPRQYFA